MRHEVTITVDAPADRVWQAISDVEKWSEWTPTVTEVRLHGGGELAQGSVATLRQPQQPAREWTVTELVEGRSFTWTSTGLGLRFSAEHIVTERDGTSVTLVFSMAGPLEPLAKLVAGKAIRRAVDTEAASLKKRCET
ncbi:SRPBCC family protein [Actinophytocola sp.]|uniref:SRPBCC family protein n=1 Tax=Actinophytocola sp. TaxID=1872138 RepID=UPI002ED57EAE